MFGVGGQRASATWSAPRAQRMEPIKPMKRVKRGSLPAAVARRDWQDPRQTSGRARSRRLGLAKARQPLVSAGPKLRAQSSGRDARL